MNNKTSSNLTSDLLNDISWNYILKENGNDKFSGVNLCVESKLYKNIEEQMIACFFTEPEKLKTTILKECHFVDYEMKNLFKFIKKFYEIFNSLDLGVMMNRAKDKEKLYCLVKIITNYNTGLKSQYESTEKEMIEKYRLTMIKEEFIKAIYGDCTIEEFKKNIKEV
ncbi:MAG: hypothetical protein RRY22_04245 [Bacilli bacterium]